MDDQKRQHVRVNRFSFSLGFRLSFLPVNKNMESPIFYVMHPNEFWKVILINVLRCAPPTFCSRRSHTHRKHWNTLGLWSFTHTPHTFHHCRRTSTHITYTCAHPWSEHIYLGTAFTIADVFILPYWSACEWKSWLIAPRPETSLCVVIRFLFTSQASQNSMLLKLAYYDVVLLWKRWSQTLCQAQQN